MKTLGPATPWGLLAEDDDNDAALTMRAFRPWKDRYRLVRAADGQFAREILAAELTAPALVVLDLKMPRANGLDVMRGLPARSERPYPVAIFTSSSEPRDEASAEELGSDGYFVKPVDFEPYVDQAAKLFASFLTVPTQGRR